MGKVSLAMRTRRALTVIVVLAAGAVAACAGTGVITNDSRQSGYDPSLIGDVAARGGMALEVKGDPFPNDGGRFAEIAARALTQSHRGPEFTVFADPAEAPDGSMRTVVIANPQAPVTPANACTASVSGDPVAGGETLSITATLCRNDKAVVKMTGRALDVAGPDDPKVDQLFRQIGLQLYPRRNDAMREDGRADVWP